MHKRIEKTYKMGKIAFHGNRRKNAVDVTVTVYLHEDGFIEFAASGSVWNTTHTDIVDRGQCLDELAKFPSIANNPIFAEIYRYWKAYHLNGLNVGTARQIAALDAAGVSRNASDYDEACDYLRHIGLFEDTLGEGESVEGLPAGALFKYGHGWVRHELPENVCARVLQLINADNLAA